MNKIKSHLDRTLAKKIKKAVNKAQKPVPFSAVRFAEENALTQKELRAKFPKKPPTLQQRNQAKKKAAALKVTEVKVKTSSKKLSKRTTPGLVAIQSAPAYPHKEGGAWIRTLTKQGAAQRTVRSRGKRGRP